MASDRAAIRITKEIQEIRKESDLSLAVACDDSNVRQVKSLIIGPPGTPYEYGFFEFAVQFGHSYPTDPPKVLAKTTNGGRTRFSPNIYAGGKVCLSILGTWKGESGESWSSAQGLESILLSIQSLMSNKPYENEPGFENTSSTDASRANGYIAKIRHETLNIAVIKRLEECLLLPVPSSVHVPSPGDLEGTPMTFTRLPSGASAMVTLPPFADLCKRRFLWYFSQYLNTIETEAASHNDGQPFMEMPFENQTNGMSGTFVYGNLKRRLLAIKAKLDDECQSWATQGQQAFRQESGLAVSLRRQFNQIEELNKLSVFNLEMTLVDSNPFLWRLVLFGKNTSKLEGGVFEIEMYISPHFPEEQPRSILKTPIFHHRVAEDGTICYFVQKPDQVKSHVDAIIEALEGDSAPYDPRTIVRPEASKLYWGNAEEQKQYNRRLRRSIEASANG